MSPYEKCEDGLLKCAAEYLFVGLLVLWIAAPGLILLYLLMHRLAGWPL